MKKNLFIFILSITFCSTVFSHGVDFVTISGGTGIEAKYDTGEPISHAEVTVWSPANSEDPFQTGITDQNGRFFFYPDVPGQWRVVVNDWTGHGGTVKIEVNDNMKPLAEPAGSLPGRGVKVLTGVAVIFGLTGLLFFYMSGRERRRKKSAHS